MQMIHGCIWIPGPGFGTIDIPFKLFGARLDLPPRTIIFDNLFDGKCQVSRKKCNPLGFTIDPYYPGRTLEGLEHHNPIVGNNSRSFTLALSSSTFCFRRPRAQWPLHGKISSIQPPNGVYCPALSVLHNSGNQSQKNVQREDM